MKNLSLIQRFSLISLAAMIVFAIAFGKLLGESMERQMLQGSIEETADIVHQNVVKHFAREELVLPKTGRAYDDFAEEIEHLSLGGEIENIEIWNRDMVVVWARDRKSVGKHFPDNNDLKEALKGKVVSELTNSESEKKDEGHSPEIRVNNSGGAEREGHHDHGHEKTAHEVKRLLELYVPLMFGDEDDSEVMVVFEIYRNINHLYHNIAHHKRLIWYWTSAGFTALYVVLFGIMWNASRRMNMQTKEIKQSKQDWEETFNSITDMITVHDREFNIVRANRSAKQTLGLPSLETSIKCYKFFHGSGEVPQGCAGSQCVHMGTASSTEFFEPHLNKFIEIRAIPRIDENHNMDGLIHVVRDISDRKRDEELIQTQLDRLNALRSIDRAIIGSIDMNITLDIFLDQTVRHMNVDAGTVLLLNNHAQTLEYVMSKGFRSPSLRQVRLRLGEGNAGCAALERRIVGVPDLRHYKGGAGSPKFIDDEGFVSCFAVPLIAKGQVKGVLELYHRSAMETDADRLEFLEAIADQGAIAIDNATLFNDLQKSNVELALAYNSTIEGWSRALDLRDKETEGHTQRVTEITIHVARELGIPEESVVHFRRGALLHDIGKMGVPDNILLKPGPLTDDEWEIMKMHPEYAYQMLYPIEYLRPAIDIPYYHHEKWDGSGYPKGLKGHDIPISARIFAVADVWDALRSDRPYRAAWSKAKVVEHIRALSGTHFDPRIARVFLQLVDAMEEQVVNYS